MFGVMPSRLIELTIFFNQYCPMQIKKNSPFLFQNPWNEVRENFERIQRSHLFCEWLYFLTRWSSYYQVKSFLKNDLLNCKKNLEMKLV